MGIKSFECLHCFEVDIVAYFIQLRDGRLVSENLCVIKQEYISTLEVINLLIQLNGLVILLSSAFSFHYHDYDDEAEKELKLSAPLKNGIFKSIMRISNLDYILISLVEL